MAISACSTCHALLLTRLRARLSFLASLRSSSQVRSLKYKAVQDPAVLAYHWDTIPPSPIQLDSATAFFKTHPPRRLWTATEWRKHGHAVSSIPQGLGTQLIPEVTFLGRSNVGKSSLLNALLHAPRLNHVGPRPGKTTMMHAWALSASNPVTGGAGPGGEMDIRLAVLDVPGYGYGSRDDAGREIVTYLRQRKQLRRAFVLIDALHGIKSSDKQMIELLRREGISYQIIVSKADRLLATSMGGGNIRLQAFFELLRKDYVQPEDKPGVAGLGEILAVGNLGDGRKNTTRVKEKDMLGIAQVRYAVLVAAGLEASSTKPTTSTRDKEREAETMAKKTLQDMARKLGMPAPLLKSGYATPPYQTSPNLSPANQSPLSNPSLTPSNAHHPTQTRKISSPTPRRPAQPPLPSPPSASTSPNPTPPSSSSYPSVGGLAELEDAVASRRPSPPKSKPRRRSKAFPRLSPTPSA